MKGKHVEELQLWTWRLKVEQNLRKVRSCFRNTNTILRNCLNYQKIDILIHFTVITKFSLNLVDQEKNNVRVSLHSVDQSINKKRKEKELMKVKEEIMSISDDDDNKIVLNFFNNAIFSLLYSDLQRNYKQISR